MKSKIFLNQIFRTDEKKNFELPDGSMVEIGKERYKFPEIFFEERVKTTFLIFRVMVIKGS